MQQTSQRAARGIESAHSDATYPTLVTFGMSRVAPSERTTTPMSGMSMAEAAALQSRGGAGTGISGEAILRPDHGFLLRAGLDSLAAVAALRARGCKAVLHGSMIEMSIQSFADQNCKDLLKDLAVCFVDEHYHLQGASQMELRCAADVVHLAAAVETRLTRGTKMNDTSSRRYCTVCPEPLFALGMTLAPAATASQCSSSLCWRAVLCARAGYSSLT